MTASVEAHAVRERPKVFSAWEVRAILDGSKTQMRGVVKSRSRSRPESALRDEGDGWWPFESNDGHSVLCNDGNEYPMSCPYGAPGDRLWVRETWAPHPDGDGAVYRATDPGWDDSGSGLKWRPSIHMPRWASRLTLEITDVRVQRLRDISDDDIRAEGVTGNAVAALRGVGESGADLEVNCSPIGLWCLGWSAINGEESWAVNLWVWAISFRRLP